MIDGMYIYIYKNLNLGLAKVLNEMMKGLVKSNNRQFLLWETNGKKNLGGPDSCSACE